jgi:hypothetical protein
MSFVSPLAWGLTIGVAAGGLNLIDTALEPLADDTVGSMSIWAGALMFLWVVIGFEAGRQTGCFRDALIGGALVGTGTMAMFHLAAIVRVNMFLWQIQYRGDWQNLVARFHGSNFRSLRTYANYEYVSLTPMLLTLGAMAGAVTGTLGGAVSKMFQTSRSPR